MSRSSGRSSEARNRTSRPVPHASTEISAPAAANISSVWVRVATRSRTIVSPVASRPANRMADFTWALAIDGVHSIPCRWPPPTTSGGRSVGPRPSTLAPIAASGSAILSIGRAESDSSPVSVVAQGRPAATPARSRMPVPELAQSISPASCRRPRPPSMTTVSPPRLTVAPSAATAAAVRITSSPSDSPRTVLVPWANAPMSRARCEIDLSPGVRTEPVSARPPAMVTASVRCGSVMTARSPCRRGRDPRWRGAAPRPRRRRRPA